VLSTGAGKHAHLFRQRFVTHAAGKKPRVRRHASAQQRNIVWTCAGRRRTSSAFLEVAVCCK
jgi:hypothetical protein